MHRRAIVSNKNIAPIYGAGQFSQTNLSHQTDPKVTAKSLNAINGLAILGATEKEDLTRIPPFQSDH
jgi:hypothetical protein